MTDPWEPPEAQFAFLPPDRHLETKGPTEPRRLIRKLLKRKTKQAGHLRNLSKILDTIPEPGESVHIVGGGAFDFFDWVPHLLALMGRPAEGLFSTWTMNRGNVLDLLELYDEGKLTAVTMLTGLYFKRRESAVYATLLEGLESRGQRYLAFLNHTKLILLRSGNDCLTVEGSANFTSNPRLEQYVISNDCDLFRFHVGWIEELAW